MQAGFGAARMSRPDRCEPKRSGPVFANAPTAHIRKFSSYRFPGQFAGKKPPLPWLDPGAFRKAAREDPDLGKQTRLLLYEAYQMSTYGVTILAVWIAALFSLGFAAGWFARDRRSRRRRKRLA
jgi:hypothetical protein